MSLKKAVQMVSGSILLRIHWSDSSHSMYFNPLGSGTEEKNEAFKNETSVPFGIH